MPKPHSQLPTKSLILLNQLLSKKALCESSATGENLLIDIVLQKTTSQTASDVKFSQRAKLTEVHKMSTVNGVIEYIKKQGDFDLDRNMVEIKGIREILEKYGIDYDSFTAQEQRLLYEELMNLAHENEVFDYYKQLEED